MTAASLSVATGMAAVWKEYRHNTTRYNLKYELTRKKKKVIGSVQRLLQYCQLLGEFPVIFRWLFGIFQCISKFVFIYLIFIYSASSCGIPVWETLHQTDNRPKAMKRKSLPCRELNTGRQDFIKWSSWDNSSPLQTGQPWCSELPRKDCESQWVSGKSTRRQKMRYFQSVGGFLATVV